MNTGELGERLKPPGLNPGTAESSRAFESHTLRQNVIDASQDIVSLWKAQKISGLSRAERNTSIDEVRSRLIIAVENMADSPREREQWEYIWIHIITPSELNDWGAKGWELCYGYDSRNAFKQETQYCFFKRRK